MMKKTNQWIFLSIMLLLLNYCAVQKPIQLGNDLPPSPVVFAGDIALQEAFDLIQAGEPDRAISVIQTSAASLEAKHVAFGFAFFAKNRTAIAMEQFERALELNPENQDALWGLARVYEKMGAVEKAFSLYSRIVARYPENVKARQRFSEIRSQELQRFLQNAEKSRMEGRDSQYIQWLEKAAEFAPDNTDIQRQIGDYFYIQKSYERALPHYEFILRIEPDNRDILLILLDLFEKSNKLDRALLIVDRLLELTPQDPVLASKREEIKEKFQLSNLPPKFKAIFFKNEVNREDLAALVGYYFGEELDINGVPVIMTDIDKSFAREEIIKVASAGIIPARPNHTFDRFSPINRAGFSAILNVLINYLEKRGKTVLLAPVENASIPSDISPMHKNYAVIQFLINARIMTLDEEQRFNPTAPLSPNEVVMALQKILDNLK